MTKKKKKSFGGFLLFVLIVALISNGTGKSDEKESSSPQTETSSTEVQTITNTVNESSKKIETVEEVLEVKSTTVSEYKSEYTNGEFTPEHDQEYLDTRMKIYNFLENKGYDVKTDFGVPRIVKTDADLGANSEGWIATLNYNGKLTDFSVVLYMGEVSGLRPVEKLSEK